MDGGVDGGGGSIARVIDITNTVEACVARYTLGLLMLYTSIRFKQTVLDTTNLLQSTDGSALAHAAHAAPSVDCN